MAMLSLIFLTLAINAIPNLALMDNINFCNPKEADKKPLLKKVILNTKSHPAKNCKKCYFLISDVDGRIGPCVGDGRGTVHADVDMILARRTCAKYSGATLPIIKSAEENEVIRQLASGAKPTLNRYVPLGIQSHEVDEKIIRVKWDDNAVTVNEKGKKIYGKEWAWQERQNATFLYTADGSWLSKLSTRADSVIILVCQQNLPVKQGSRAKIGKPGQILPPVPQRDLPKSTNFCDDTQAKKDPRNNLIITKKAIGKKCFFAVKYDERDIGKCAMSHPLNIVINMVRAREICSKFNARLPSLSEKKENDAISELGWDLVMEFFKDLIFPLGLKYTSTANGYAIKFDDGTSLNLQEHAKFYDVLTWGGGGGELTFIHTGKANQWWSYPPSKITMPVQLVCEQNSAKPVTGERISHG